MSLLLAAFLHPAFATTFFQRPFPKTVRSAPAIVRGRAGSSAANWVVDPDGNKRIYTFTPLESVEVIKGEVSGGTLMVRTLGGEKDGIGLHVPGSPEFSRGEDVVLMLGEPNPDGSRDVEGLVMGKYDVDVDSEGNEILKGPGLNPMGNEGPVSHEDLSQNSDVAGRNGTKWSVLALKELVQSQAESPEDLDESAQVAPQTSTGTQTEIQPSAPRSASELQTPHPEGENNSESHGKGLAVILGVAALIFGFGYFVKKITRK